MSNSPQNVIDLDYYSISTKKNVKRQCTFVLVADEHRMLPDYYLQADSEEQLELWVGHLQQHMTTGSVLDKWLERLDINSQDTPSSSLHVPPNSSHQQQILDHHHHHHLRTHRSVESIHTLGSLPSSSMIIQRTSFTNDRRPSYQSTHSNTSTTSHNSVSTCATVNTSSTTNTIQHRQSNHNLKQNKLFSTRLFSKKNSNSNSNNLSSSSSSSLLSSPTPIDVATISTPSLSMLATTTNPSSSFSSSPGHHTTSLDLDHHPIELNPHPHHQFLKKEKVNRRISFHLDHLKNHHHKNNNQHQHQVTIDPIISSSSSSSLMDKPYYSSSESCSSTSSYNPNQQPLVTPIIHPSEYNHDDDPEVRFKLRQQQQKEMNLVLSQSVSTK